MQKELLNDAFNTFKEASRTLENQYSSLEDRIESLVSLRTRLSARCS